MMCPAPDRMDLYLEDDLSLPERVEFERHLQTCDACRRELEDRRFLGLAISSLPPVEVPDGFAQAVMAKIPRARRTGFIWVLGAAAGAGALLTALLGNHLAAGGRLARVLDTAGRSVVALFGLLIPLAAKLFMLLRALFDLVRGAGEVLLRGLGILSPLHKPELIGAVLALGSALIVLSIFGLRKFASPGERP